MTAATRLRARADAYSNDAAALRALGETDAALICETVRDELRSVAAQLDDPAEHPDAWKWIDQR